jgi:hypothetical protein
VPAAYPANRWAVFDIDWNSNKPTWGAAQPQNCSEMMVQQIEDMAASISPQPATPKRYMVYRNFVKALPLLTPVREIMNDPSYDIWFVNFSAAVQANHAVSHVPLCDVNMTLCGKGAKYRYSPHAVLQPPKCSHLYHDPDQMPISGTAACGPTGRCDTGRIPQGNYLWDFRQANVTVKGVKMVDWFIEKYIFAELDGLGNPLISGFYIGKSSPDSPLQTACSLANYFIGRSICWSIGAALSRRPGCMLARSPADDVWASGADVDGGPSEVNTHWKADTGFSDADTRSIPHHETVSTTRPPPYSSTKG